MLVVNGAPRDLLEPEVCPYERTTQAVTRGIEARRCDGRIPLPLRATQGMRCRRPSLLQVETGRPLVIPCTEYRHPVLGTSKGLRLSRAGFGRGVNSRDVGRFGEGGLVVLVQAVERLSHGVVVSSVLAVETTNPPPARRSVSRMAIYWTPLSLWCTRALVSWSSLRRVHRPMFSAFRARSVRRLVDSCQPTTRRRKTSSRNAA